MRTPPIDGAPDGLALSMSAMAYGEDRFGSDTGQKLSLGPPASDMIPKCQGSAAPPFVRPGPEVLNETIPVFFIGRNRDGCWVARDGNGRFGGLFWRKQAALRFAQRSAWPARCATVFPQARFELDIENAGNPLVGCIGAARRLLARRLQRFIVAIRNTARF